MTKKLTKKEILSICAMTYLASACIIFIVDLFRYIRLINNPDTQYLQPDLLQYLLSGTLSSLIMAPITTVAPFVAMFIDPKILVMIFCLVISAILLDYMSHALYRFNNKKIRYALLLLGWNCIGIYSLPIIILKYAM